MTIINMLCPRNHTNKNGCHALHPKVQHSSCATENCRYDVFNGHKMLTCRHESFTASPFQTLASTLHKHKPRAIDERSGSGDLEPFATTARPRHAAKVLWSSLFLHTRAHQTQQTHAVPTTSYRFVKPSCDMLLMGELPLRGRHVVSIKLRQRLHNG